MSLAVLSGVVVALSAAARRSVAFVCTPGSGSGDTVPVTPAGSPVTEKVTGPLEPFRRVTRAGTFLGASLQHRHGVRRNGDRHVGDRLSGERQREIVESQLAPHAPGAFGDEVEAGDVRYGAHYRDLRGEANTDGDRRRTRQGVVCA